MSEALKECDNPRVASHIASGGGLAGDTGESHRDEERTGSRFGKGNGSRRASSSGGQAERRRDGARRSVIMTRLRRVCWLNGSMKPDSSLERSSSVERLSPQLRTKGAAGTTGQAVLVWETQDDGAPHDCGRDRGGGEGACDRDSLKAVCRSM